MSNSLPTIRVQNEQLEAEILLQGAQLMHFAPRGQKPWIFTNNQTPFTPGKEIYGGVPLVFPWFNRLKEHPDAPNHGFARQAIWTVEENSEEVHSPSGRLSNVVVLGLSSEDVEAQGLSSPFWNHPFVARMAFALGERLQIRFSLVNRGSEPFRFECAFHPYFAVSDVRRTTVEGAENGIWLSDGAPILSEEIAFPPFGARLFEHSQGPILIREPERTFRISATDGWRSSVVWNPGEAMEDLIESDWPHFVCVESGALRSNAIQLGGGECYTLSVSVELD